MRGEPDPKPEGRIIDPLAGREKLLREGRCRVCGRPAFGPHGLTRHHLVARSLQGDDVDENLVAVCGDGVQGCHGILETHPRGWKQTAGRLRSRLRPDEIDYVLQKKGQRFLDRYYPNRGY